MVWIAGAPRPDWTSARAMAPASAIVALLFAMKGTRHAYLSQSLLIAGLS